MTKARDLANASTALSAVSATELGYLDGVTSAVQTQLNTKQPTVANVSDTEIGYLDGVTSAIQTQLNTKAPTASPLLTGDVGINVSSPGHPIHAQSSGTSTTVGGNVVARLQSNGSGRDATILLSDNVANSTSISMLSGATVFRQNGTEALRIASAGATTVAYTTTSGGAVRNIYMSTSAPSGGSDGDVWIQYTA